MPPDDGRDRDAVAREALSWLFRLRSGEMTEDEADGLLRWRAGDPARARALSDAVKLRRRLVETARTFGAGDDGEAVPVGRSASARGRGAGGRAAMGRRAFLGTAVAASVGAVGLARPPFGLWPSLAELRSDYRTRAGEQRMIVVAQGLTIELNTRSSVTRHDGAGRYGIRLIEGEIAVDATDPAQPVVIETDAGTISARQARLGIRLVAAGTSVVCLAGDARVVDRRGRASLLGAGQQMLFDGEAAGVVTAADLDTADAWRRGLLVFDGEPLATVIDEINRYRPGRILLANRALGRFPITGTFQLARLARAVMQVQQVVGATATDLPGGIVLLT